MKKAGKLKKAVKRKRTQRQVTQLRVSADAMSRIANRLTVLEDIVAGSFHNLSEKLAKIEQVRTFNNGEYDAICNAYARMAVSFNIACDRLKSIAARLDDESAQPTSRGLETAAPYINQSPPPTN